MIHSFNAFRVYRFFLVTPAFLLGAVLLLGACADDEAVLPEYVERPVEELYNEAMNAMQERQYLKAAPLFNEVERQHPYSQWAVKAQLMAAYSHYMSNKYDDAVIALDRYIQLHPSNEDVVYAHYLKGLSYYEQITDVTRDQEATRLARVTFEQILARFPDSGYAKDARIKLDLTFDHLAGKEMEVGRFELRRKNYLAAINRFKRVIELYQTTTHVPEALHRMTEAYLALGLEDEAKKAAAVLGHNFPGSDWYEDSYALLGGERVSGKGDAAPEDGKSWYKFW